MQDWITILLPFVLLMSRIVALLFASPIFGSRAVPVPVRVGMAMVVTWFFAVINPPTIELANVHYMQAIVLIMQEAIIGLGIGLALRLVYSAIHQGGLMASQQMGFADAGVIDPTSGERSKPIATMLEMLFALLFLNAGGHRFIIKLAAASFRGFPIASTPNIEILTGGIVEAGSAMLLFGLKLAAPMLGGFLILAVMLCILARVLPEMNILMASFPLRIGIGIFLAAAIMPMLNAFTNELARWMSGFLVISG